MFDANFSGTLPPPALQTMHGCNVPPLPHWTFFLLHHLRLVCNWRCAGIDNFTKFRNWRHFHERGICSSDKPEELTTVIKQGSALTSVTSWSSCNNFCCGDSSNFTTSGHVWNTTSTSDCYNGMSECWLHYTPMNRLKNEQNSHESTATK